jgi:uncharacterized membrane protein
VAKPTGARDPSCKSTILIVILILIGAAALRIRSLTARGYLYDEAWIAELASGRGSAHLGLPADQVLPMPDFFSLDGQAALPWWKIWTKMECTHPPLYFIGLRLWMEIAGTSDGAERGFSVLASLIAIGLLFDIAQLCGGRFVAVWACILMAISQPQIEYARETRNYAWLLVGALVAADAIVRIEKLGPSRRRLALLVIGVLATLLTHYFGVGILIGMAIYSAIRFRGRARAQSLGAFGLALLIFLLCWGPFMWQQRSLALTSDQSTNFLLDNPDFHIQHTFWRLMVLPGVLLAEPRNAAATAVCPCGVLLYFLPLFLLRRRGDLWFWMLWIVGVIGLVATLDLTRGTHHLGIVRYTLLAGPAIYGLIPLLSAGIKRWAWLRHGIPAMAALYCLVGLPHAYESDIADPRSIVARLHSMLGPRDLLVFISMGNNQWWARGQYLLFSRYIEPESCPAVILDAPAGVEVTRRALASDHIVAFTLGENPADFILGLHPLGAAKFPGQGTVWILTGVKY